LRFDPALCFRSILLTAFTAFPYNQNHASLCAFFFMPTSKEILLRYRSYGHVRFELPEQLCSAEARERLTPALLQLNGVYRVDLYRRQRKLSIRFTEEICDFLTLAKHLAAVASHLEKHLQRSGIRAASSTASVFKEKLSGSKAGQWAKNKYQESKETVQAIKVLGKLGSKKKAAILKDPEKALVDFFNDVLVLYLIKTHWPLITREWLPKPFRYRYEWLSVFYMMYLLVRSRLPKK
jgi:hypothetical protein